ncbi:MAG: TonB-dependent receptor [Bacteroidales bacterium]|nr:TonB-dependent receptor [Bacteroidales bacterium]
MKKLNLIVIALVICNTLFAQSISIKGTVKDAQTNDKLPYANCILQYKTDTVGIYKGVITEDDGSFTFKKIRKRDLILKISFVGYKTYRQEINSSQFDGGVDINLGEIALESDEALEEVKIVAERKRIVTEGDKLTMNVDDGMANMVTNAFELLKLVPGVMIDNSENITLNGQSGVQFQYNGRDMKLDWSAVKDMLKGMTPEMIDSYEVLKNPGVKYDAEGTAGIINIKIKKNQQYGINGSASLVGNYRDDRTYHYNPSVRLNYVNDKWIISGGLSYTDNYYGDPYGADSSNRYTWIGQDTVLFRNIDDKWQGNTKGLDFNFSASYSLDSVSTLGFYSYYGNYHQPTSEGKHFTFMSHNPAYYLTDSLYNQTGKVKTQNNLVYLGLNYVKKMDTMDSKFSMDLDYNNRFNGSERQTILDYYNVLPDGSNSLSRSTDNKRKLDNKQQNLSFRADYYKPFTKDLIFEAGAKTAFAFSDNDYKSEVLQGATYIDNSMETNRFKYKENINSLYASVTDKFFSSKLSVRLGVRLEQTNTKGTQVVNDTTIKTHYLNLFPNVKLGWKFKDDNGISLNYYYRISRPYSDNLNPFIRKMSEYSYETGNPELKPQYSHLISLSHSYKYMLFTSVYYYYTTDHLYNLSTPLNDSYGFAYNPLAVISRPVNTGKSHSLNGNISFDKLLFDIWNINLSFTYYYLYVDMALDGNQTSLDTWGYNFNLYTSLNLPNKWRFSVYYGCGSAGQYGLTKYNGWQWLSFDAGKSFFEDKLNVDFSIGWVVGKKDYNKTEYLNSITESWSRATPPNISLTLRYKFGKYYDNKQIKKRQLENFDDRSNGTNQGGGRR